MIDTNEIEHHESEDLSEHELQAAVGSESKGVMVTGAASSDHSAVSSLSYSSLMGGELNIDGTHCYPAEELNESVIDVVSGGAKPTGLFEQAVKSGSEMPVAYKAELLASTLVGPATAFSVGMGATSLQNIIANKKASH